MERCRGTSRKGLHGVEGNLSPPLVGGAIERRRWDARRSRQGSRWRGTYPLLGRSAKRLGQPSTSLRPRFLTVVGSVHRCDQGDKRRKRPVRTRYAEPTQGWGY